MEIPNLTAQQEQRFRAQVARSGDDACWPWTGRSDPDGYGRIAFGNAAKGTFRAHRAHRIAYALARGPIPDGLQVCHRCDNPPCCNPAHLFLGTAAENQHDCFRKGRRARGEANGMRTRPEARLRGDAHWSHQRPEFLARGERHASAKLDGARVLEIRARSAAGESLYQLARSYGVTPQSIHAIVRRQSWKHI